jgi:hypothetical protein
MDKSFEKKKKSSTNDSVAGFCCSGWRSTRKIGNAFFFLQSSFVSFYFLITRHLSGKHLGSTNNRALC